MSVCVRLSTPSTTREYLYVLLNLRDDYMLNFKLYLLLVQVKCPECRAEHRIPYQGVQAFPTNVTLQRFLELRMEITGEPPDPTSGNCIKFGREY